MLNQSNLLFLDHQYQTGGRCLRSGVKCHIKAWFPSVGTLTAQPVTVKFAVNESQD